MNPVGDVHLHTGNYGYFQNRGGYIASSGMAGRRFRKGATPGALREHTKIEVKEKNVPEDTHETTAKAPVEKKQGTTDVSMVNKDQVS